MHSLTHRQRVAALVLAIVAVGFVSLDVTGSGLAGAHSGAQGALGSLYRGTDAVVGPARRFVQGVPDAASNRAKVEQLTRENAALAAKLAAQQADATTTRQLAALQLLADTGNYPIVAAKVTGFGPGEGFDWTVTVDVGSASGITVNQTVTDGNNLIGRVLHVNSASSVVLLGADPDSGIGVRDVRNGELAVATGAGERGFTVAPLDPQADLRVGDVLRTGPAGQSSYVAGLAVATITSVRRASDGSVVAVAKAAAAPTTLDLVGIIAPGAPADAARAPLAPTTSGSTKSGSGR
jgi:rod shape-determining protein MreC